MSQPATIPAPGKDLNAHEKRAWKALAEVVDPLRIATRADLIAFRHTAVTLGMIERARAELSKSPSLTYEVVTENGFSFRKRPEVEIIATFEKILDAKLARFGLTPAEREKVSTIGDEGGGDPLDEFAVNDAGAA